MPSGRWAHLEQFTGGLADLYATGLTCPIRRITIMDSLEDEPATDILETMLRYARPAHLKLEGLASSLLGDSDRGFLSMLRDDTECTSNLINLAVRICFDANVREKGLMAILDNLVLALTNLRLKFLELTLDTSCDLDPFSRLQDTLQWMRVHYDGRMPESYGQDPIPLTPVEVALSSLDVDALIVRLESIPSLEAAVVVLKPSRNIDTNIERTFTKSSSGLAGPEQWRSWLPGKTPFTRAL